MILTRHRLLTGLIAAPIVVRAGMLMPVKALELPSPREINIYPKNPQIGWESWKLHGYGADGSRITEVMSCGISTAEFRTLDTVEHVVYDGNMWINPVVREWLAA